MSRQLSRPELDCKYVVGCEGKSQSVGTCYQPESERRLKKAWREVAAHKQCNLVTNMLSCIYIDLEMNRASR